MIPMLKRLLSGSRESVWGRSYKDLYNRFQTMRGKKLRYQQVFDCQGLWIEVGVERALGLNSKREIEEFGLEEFARRERIVLVREHASAVEPVERQQPPGRQVRPWRQAWPRISPPAFSTEMGTARRI